MNDPKNRGRMLRFGVAFSFLQLLTFNLTPSANGAVVINEVAFDEPSGSPDWVELFNNGSSAVSINSWVITDQDAAAGNEVTISLSTPVPAGAFVLVYIDTTSTNDTDFTDNKAILYSGTATTVSLAATEDEVALYNSSTLSSSTIVDFLAYVTDGSYGGVSDQTNAINAGIWSSGTAVTANDTGSGYSLGLVSDGDDTNAVADWVQVSSPTPGSTNNAATAPVEICTNLVDDDSDGQADCDDSDCATHTSCLKTTTVSSTTKVVEVDDTRNPFSPFDADTKLQSAQIYFDAKSAGVVKTVRIADVRGETVRMLVNNDYGPNNASYSGKAFGNVFWDGRDDGGEIVPVGIYIVFFEGVDPATGQRVTGRDTVAMGRPFE